MPGQEVTLPSHVASVQELFDLYMEALYPQLQPGMSSVIIAQGAKMMQSVDERRHAKHGSEAVGFELLTAEATGLFGAIVTELGMSLQEAATHAARFGVRARGVVHQP